MARLARKAASTSEMGRFKTELLTQKDNLRGLEGLNVEWVKHAIIRTVHSRIILDIDSSESPVHGQQEAAAYNGHFECVCYHPLFCFNQHGDCERAVLRPGNVHSAEGWQEFIEPIVERYLKAAVRLLFRADAAFAKPELYDYLGTRQIGTPSGCPPTKCCRGQSRTCWYGLLSGHPGSRSSPITTSPIRPRVGMFLGE